MNGMALWVIYDRPSDFPRHFVARRQWIGADGRIAVDHAAVVSPSLEKLREHVRQHGGDFCLGRQPDDEPRIVEVWA